MSEVGNGNSLLYVTYFHLTILRYKSAVRVVIFFSRLFTDQERKIIWFKRALVPNMYMWMFLIHMTGSFA